VTADERYLNPTEAARRLGVSVKALRLYESRGLVKPLRSAADWRAYGPEQMARLHQILALKRLGLPLARIGELLQSRGVGLESVLAMQEHALAGESSRVGRALELVRAARARLASGQTLSIDDLATLTKETTMTNKATPEEMKEIFDPISAKYFTPEESRALTSRKFDQEAVGRQWESVIAGAKIAMANGDPAAPAALDVARRWKALVDQFTGGDPTVAAKVRSVWNDAMGDPKAAPRLPLSPEVFEFVGKSMIKLKEQEGLKVNPSAPHGPQPG
jgi:DNA-binding transcriptional MerR regulator